MLLSAAIIETTRAIELDVNTRTRQVAFGWEDVIIET